MKRKTETGTSSWRVTIDPENLRRQVSERRSALGLSLRDVAQKAGVSPTTVNKLEKGDPGVQLDSFLRVLSVLELLPENVIKTDGKTTLAAPTSLERKIARWSSAHDAPQVLDKLAELLRELPNEN